MVNTGVSARCLLLSAIHISPTQRLVAQKLNPFVQQGAPSNRARLELGDGSAKYLAGRILGKNFTCQDADNPLGGTELGLGAPKIFLQLKV